jgi:hypothetical protein
LRFRDLFLLVPVASPTDAAAGDADSGMALSFNVRNTKLDLLCRMPGIRYRRSRSNRS